jgi:mRNA interferase MazF
MNIQQGDVYWLALDGDIPHPHVVVQATAGDAAVLVCALTTNLKRVALPGNVLLEAGEANLPRQSLVEVAKLSTIESGQLGAYIGTLSPERVAQILAGMDFVRRSFFSR